MATRTISFVIEAPTVAAIDLFISEFAKGNGWRSQALDGDVGAFAGRMLFESMYGTVEGSRGETAAQAARLAAVAEVRNNIKLRLV